MLLLLQMVHDMVGTGDAVAQIPIRNTEGQPQDVPLPIHVALMLITTSVSLISSCELCSSRALRPADLSPVRYSPSPSLPRFGDEAHDYGGRTTH